MSEAQAKFIKTLVLKLTKKTKSEIAGKSLVISVKGQDTLNYRIKSDGTLDKNFINKLQASGLISTLKEHLTNDEILNDGRTIEVK